MCGIAGFIETSPGADRRDHGELIRRMTSALEHRGPDSSGEWFEPAVGLALGHRRLAVLDLSAEGSQPMVSACGRFVLVFNGEIYNYRQLREALEKESGHLAWRGTSDTEVLLAAISRWGLDATLARLNGMFAFALWDRQLATLSLARDRMGEKPLYYGYNQGLFLFASELKAIKQNPRSRLELNRDSLTLLLRHGYIPDPHAIYQGLAKLPAAGVLHLDLATLQRRELPIPGCYWSLREVVASGRETPLRSPPAVLQEQLDDLLREAVALRMTADVPLGVFLSGGVDSSLIAALMQAQSRQPIKTFSIGFHEAGFNEAGYASRVAQHLGTEHTEHYVTAAEALATIPRLPAIFDEPFADPSQIPSLLVSGLARQKVTVGLTGDGGDELFAGYTRYGIGTRVHDRINRMPRSARKSLAVLLAGAPPRLLRLAEKWFPATAGDFGRKGTLPDKLERLAAMLVAQSPARFYTAMISHWPDPVAVVPGSREPMTLLTGELGEENFSGLYEMMMYLDSSSYLPGDILTKVDRASMAFGLEARVPFLDHRVVELAWKIPLSAKVDERGGKAILRRLLAGHVPPQLTERPKMGFGIPLDQWLRGPLREWAEELLAEGRLRREGVFAPGPIRHRWEEHLSGVRNWHFCLWDVLMFQSWWEQQ